jgi:hypothetical protein
MTKCLVATAGIALLGVYFLSSSSAEAMTITLPAKLRAASHDGNTQKVVCRQTSNGRKCSDIPSSNRQRDYQPNGNGSNPYFQQRYSPSQYQLHPWGSPYGEH